MAVPNFQAFLLPLLTLLGDGRDHRVPDVYEALAVILDVTTKDRLELLASGKQTRFENRIGWAKTYLSKAGLVEAPQRGVWKITDEGTHVLTEGPTRIDIAFLRRFPQFRTFQALTQGAQEIPALEATQENPEEALDSAYQSLRTDLIQDLLAAMKQAPPTLFERLVVELLLKMGYGGREQLGKAVGRPGDEGIDGIINEDKLGLDIVYIQAKRWQGTVGRPTVQEFTGSLEGQRANKGVLITTSQFSSDAYDYVSRIGKKVVLIDGRRLAELMIEYKLGVNTVSTYEVLKVDKDYFAGELISAAD
jgi:restriction system protein